MKYFTVELMTERGPTAMFLQAVDEADAIKKAAEYLGRNQPVSRVVECKPQAKFY